MFLFEQKLNQAGIADTRTQYLAQALDNLHTAISHCDIPSRILFAECTLTLSAQPVEYAKVEDLNQDLWGVTCREGTTWLADYHYIEYDNHDLAA